MESRVFDGDGEIDCFLEDELYYLTHRGRGMGVTDERPGNMGWSWNQSDSDWALFEQIERLKADQPIFKAALEAPDPTENLQREPVGNGIPCFPIEEFSAASRELFGPSYSYDFAALAAERADPIPKGMLCAGVGYYMEMHLYLIDRNTVTLEQGVYSVWLDDYRFYPAGGFLNDTVELTRRELSFRLNEAPSG